MEYQNKLWRVVPYLCGIPQRVRDKRLLLMLRAFFDETALNPKKDKALVIGGFLANVEEWDKVSAAWNDCLRQSPKIDYFSHRKIRSLLGKQAKEKMESLARVIAAHDLRGFCSSVSYSWFEERDKNVSRKAMGTRVYDWGFLSATKAVLLHMNLFHDEEKVDFIFDKRTELNECIPAYYELKSVYCCEFMKCAGECNPGDDKDIVALQMADLLAGEFSDLIKTKTPTDSWRIIAGKYPVAHLPCTIPPHLPSTLTVQKLGKDVLVTAGNILRRFYKDNERSTNLLIDVNELAIRKAYYDLQFKRLKSSYELDEEFKSFISNAHKSKKKKH